MAVSISIFLFGKPGVELDAEGEEIGGPPLRALGEDLRERLHHAAEAIEKLTAAGWEARMALYDVMLSHPYLHSEGEARLHVENLGLDPDQFLFMEWEEDWEDAEAGWQEEEDWQPGTEEPD